MTLPAPGLPNNEHLAELRFAEPIFENGDFLRVGDEILKVTAVDGATVTVARAQAGRPAAAHPPGSVIYALSPLLVDNLPTHGAATERVVGKIAQSLKDLRDGLGAHANQVTFIPMPVLFEIPPGEEKYSAVTANVVNGLVAGGGRYYYPGTGCAAFRDYVASVFGKDANNEDLAREVEGTWDNYHCRWGGVHCATAADREPIPEPPWWQRLANWE